MYMYVVVQLPVTNPMSDSPPYPNGLWEFWRAKFYTRCPSWQPQCNR